MPDDPNTNPVNPTVPKPSYMVDSPPADSPTADSENAPVATENVETPPPPIVSQEEPSQDSSSNNYGLPPVVTTPSPKGKSKKGIVAAILGVLLLVGGLGAGIFLVQRQQNLKSKAAGGGHWNDDGYNYCYNYGCDVSANYPSCIIMHYGSKDADDPVVNDYILRDRVSKSDYGLQDCGAEQIDASCDFGQGLVDVGWAWYRYDYDCTEPPEPTPTPSPTPTPTVTPTPAPPGCHEPCSPSNPCPNGWTCDVLPDSAPQTVCFNPSCPNDSDCVCSGTPTPTPTATPPGQTPTPTPTPPPTGYFQCLNLKAYNTSWTLLTLADLAKLKVGDKVRFTVAGDTSYGQITKAKFSINGVCTPEILLDQVKPGPAPCSTCSPEFYYEYTIPAGITSFTVDARLYVEGKGWMGKPEIGLDVVTCFDQPVPAVTD